VHFYSKMMQAAQKQKQTQKKKGKERQQWSCVEGSNRMATREAAVLNCAEDPANFAELPQLALQAPIEASQDEEELEAEAEREDIFAESGTHEMGA